MESRRKDFVIDSEASPKKVFKKSRENKFKADKKLSENNSSLYFPIRKIKEI